MASCSGPDSSWSPAARIELCGPRLLALLRQEARPNRSHPALFLRLQLLWRPFWRQPFEGIRWLMILPCRQADSQGATSGEFVSRMALLCKRHEQGNVQTRRSGYFLLVAASRLIASCFSPSGSAAAN